VKQSRKRICHCYSSKRVKEKTRTSQKAKQLTLPAAVEQKTPYEKDSKLSQEITNAVTEFIVKEMMSVNVVGFRNLLRKLDDRYQLPSRKYFSKTAIPAMYVDYRGKIPESLKCAEYYSITTDMWSSGKMEPYLAVTVHYVNEE